MRKRELKGLLTPGQDHGFTGLVSSQPPLSGEGRRAGGLRGWSMERNRLIAAVSTYQRPSAKWARRRPGSGGETMESGAILVVQRSPPAVQPRRASALPRGRGVPLPTRSGRRGGVLRVPPARGAARDAGKRYMLPLLPVRRGGSPLWQLSGGIRPGLYAGGGCRCSSSKFRVRGCAGYQPAEKREPEAASRIPAGVSVD